MGAGPSGARLGDTALPTENECKASCLNRFHDATRTQVQAAEVVVEAPARQLKDVAFRREF